MTRMRARIAERLLETTQNTAMLTTFNEVNMLPVMKLRAQYKDQFEKTHNGTRLGFMGFFVKAACEALKRYPAVNASIDGDEIVYHGYQDIGVAVSSDRGLVVPVLRNAELMNLAEVESGKVLATQVRPKSEEIEKLAGLNFARFTKSMMLSQGDFAAFLNANEADRAELLEELTGTEIYGQISQAVHQQFSDAKQKKKEFAIKLEGVTLLSDEQIAQLEEGQAQTKSQVSAFNQTLAELQKQQQWQQAFNANELSIKIGRAHV